MTILFSKELSPQPLHLNFTERLFEYHETEDTSVVLYIVYLVFLGHWAWNTATCLSAGLTSSGLQLTSATSSTHPSSTHLHSYALDYKTWNSGRTIGHPWLRNRHDQLHLKSESCLSLVSCPAAGTIYIIYLAWILGLFLFPVGQPAGCSDCLEQRDLNLLWCYASVCACLTHHFKLIRFTGLHIVWKHTNDCPL